MLNQLYDRGDTALNDAVQNDLKVLGDTLNVLLANLFLIYFKTRNYQWHLSGPTRWDYDLLLENQSTDIIICMDAVAERLQDLGLPTLHPLEEVAQRRIKRSKASKPIESEAMLQELLADKHNLVKLLGVAGTLARRLEDDTTHVLTGKWIINTDRHIWCLLKGL